MKTNQKSTKTSKAPRDEKSAAVHMLSDLPVPVFPLRPIFSRLVRALSIRHPALFERLGNYGKTIFLIDPVDMPVVLRLVPDAFDPKLEPFARKDAPEADAVISGEFFSLVRLVSGKVDGDALFFSRDLVIQGDTEAVLALRNAIDDMDIDLAEEIEDLLGFFGAPLRFAREQAAGLGVQLQKAHKRALAPVSDRIDRLEREIADLKKTATGARRRRMKKPPEGSAL